MRKFFILFFCFIILFFNSVGAEDKGTSGAIILSQPIGVRASAMAEAYTASGGDICCLYYNPAGLATVKKKQVNFAYQRGISDDSFGNVTFGLPKGKGVLAGSLIYYTADNIELIDISGNSRTVKAQQDYVVSFSYGYNLLKNFSIGANTKVLHSTLVEDFSATSLAFDFGGLYKHKNLSLGLAVQNIGAKLKYDTEEDPLPMNIRTGISYQLNNLTAGFDIVKPNDEAVKENFGIEYVIGNLFALRAGYKIGYDLDSLTCGLGFKLKNYQIDYGIAMMGEMDSTHRVSFTTSF